MKVNVARVLKTLDGQDMQDAKVVGEKVETSPLTLQKIIVEALQANVKGEESLAGTEKVKRFQLAVKVYSGDEVELSAEDIALIKDLIGKLYGPLVVGRSYELLES